MKFVRQGVDDGNSNVLRHFVEHTLLVNARDDALHPALQVARHVGDGFALAEPRLRVIQKDHEAAHALNADFEGDARAQRRLLKNQRDMLAAKRGSILRGTRLDVGGALQQIARIGGAPFGPGEQVFRNSNWQCERCGHLILRISVRLLGGAGELAGGIGFAQNAGSRKIGKAVFGGDGNEAAGR